MLTVALAALLSLSAAEPAAAPAALVPVPVTVAPWADIYVDGEKVADSATQLELWLTPGEHEVLFLHPFALPHKDRVVVEPAVPRTVNVKLSPRPARLLVFTEEDAIVDVDGTRVGTVSARQRAPLWVSLQSFTHAAKVRVRTRGGQDATHLVTLAAGQKAFVNASPTRDRSARADLETASVLWCVSADATLSAP